MVWGGVISNEDITAKTRHRGNRNDPENLRPWGLNCPPPLSNANSHPGGAAVLCLSGGCLSSWLRYGYRLAYLLQHGRKAGITAGGLHVVGGLHINPDIGRYSRCRLDL